MDESQKNNCGVKEPNHKIMYFDLHKVQKQAKLYHGVRSQDHHYLREGKMGMIGVTPNEGAFGVLVEVYTFMGVVITQKYSHSDQLLSCILTFCAFF